MDNEIDEAFVNVCFDSVPRVWKPELEYPSMFVAFTLDGAKTVLLPFMVENLSDDDETAKDQFVNYVVQFCRKKPVAALMSVCEAWIRQLKPGADMQRARADRGYVRVLLGTGKHQTFPPQSLVPIPSVKDGDTTAIFAGVQFMEKVEHGKK